jgi:hypothetical protein
MQHSQQIELKTKTDNVARKRAKTTMLFPNAVVSVTVNRTLCVNISTLVAYLTAGFHDSGTCLFLPVPP